jgi:hypothetical protein
MLELQASANDWLLMLLTLKLKLKIKKKPHSFNHNCNHYSLSEGERQQKKSTYPKRSSLFTQQFLQENAKVKVRRKKCDIRTSFEKADSNRSYKTWRSFINKLERLYWKK